MPGFMEWTVVRVFERKGTLQGAGPLGALQGITVLSQVREDSQMLYYALVFLIIALVAGILGFTGIEIAAAGVARILFFIFLVLFVVSLVSHAARRI